MPTQSPWNGSPARCNNYPEFVVFLAIGLGYWVGGFKMRGVGLGPVTGSLLVGVVIGYFVHVPVSDTAKQVLFLLSCSASATRSGRASFEACGTAAGAGPCSVSSSRWRG